MHTFVWIVLYTTVGLIALAITAHVCATDEGLATLRARLHRRRDTTTPHHDSKEGTSHEKAH